MKNVRIIRRANYLNQVTLPRELMYRANIQPEDFIEFGWDESNKCITIKAASWKAEESGK